MTELLEDLEMLKERILSERCVQELPGDSPMVTTARKLLLAGLLGRLPTNGHTASPETGLPVPLSLSPVSPVETAPEPSPVSGDATPGGRPTGETQEEVSQEPPPVPPRGGPNFCDDCGAYKPKGVCDTCHPVIAPPEPRFTRSESQRQKTSEAMKASWERRKREQEESAGAAPLALSDSPIPGPEVPYQEDSAESVTISIDRERQPGSSGAIFEARVYVLSCLDKSQGVNLRSVRNLTGWDAITASKFIRDIQDEFRQVQRQSPKTGRPLKVNEAGMANLMHAIENTSDEDEGEEEPEPGELESIEAETGAGPVFQSPTQTDKPRWWADSETRYCKTCKAALPPKYKISRTGNKQWESLFQYCLRSYCPEHSPKKGGRAKKATTA